MELMASYCLGIAGTIQAGPQMMPTIGHLLIAACSLEQAHEQAPHRIQELLLFQAGIGSNTSALHCHPFDSVIGSRTASRLGLG